MPNRHVTVINRRKNHVLGSQVIYFTSSTSHDYPHLCLDSPTVIQFSEDVQVDDGIDCQSEHADLVVIGTQANSQGRQVPRRKRDPCPGVW
jgi:hypothetical protein